MATFIEVHDAQRNGTQVVKTGRRLVNTDHIESISEFMGMTKIICSGIDPEQNSISYYDVSESYEELMEMLSV